jgi:hypothetical protein
MAGAKWLWSRRFMVLKLLGLGMLVWYLAQHGVGFEPIWVVVYLALALVPSLWFTPWW